MAVKIHCYVCDKFLEAVDVKNINQVTGKEICDQCLDKVNTAFKDMEDKKKRFLAELDALNKSAVERYKKIDKMYVNYTEACRGLFETTKAELKTLVRDIHSKKEEG